MNPSITVTEAACEYIKKMLEKQPGANFRLSVKKTGCSGYSYVPEIVATCRPDDFSFAAANGVTIFVDSQWMELLSDVQMDYVEEIKSGLKQKRLVFTNPKESSRCGCGESFHIEK